MAKKRKTHGRTFIREWRNHRNLNQDALAERVGVTQETISRLERGDIGYTQPILEAVADALGCTVADLLMRDPTNPAAIWTIWDQIPPVDRQRALGVLEVFAKKAG